MDDALGANPKHPLPILGPFVQGCHGLMVIPPGSYAESFRLPEDLVCIMLGPHEARLSFDGTHKVRHDLAANTISFHPAGSEVRAESVSNRDGFLCFVVERWARETFESDHGIQAEAGHFVANEGDPEVASIARQARQFVSNGFEGGRLRADGLALTAMASACRMMFGEPRDVGPKLPPHRLRAAVDFIEANLGEALDLTQLAEAAGYSRYHFARAFKASTGQPPHQFVIDRRISRARHAIEKTDLPLAEVALRVGFSDQSHMTTLFRNHLGVTPARLRSEERRAGRNPPTDAT
ncbi:MAG: AraC family transcriptional regulator [Myxococcota bacterium]|nr:AraC family transcriptional regulator [Myxococcota bacterium]